MALTQLQKLELNKRVDRIFHAPSNVPAKGLQPEIAFVADMTGDLESVHSSVKDAAASLKAHDKMFQNMRSNMVYWGSHKISSKVTPMSFILMGKAFEDCGIELYIEPSGSELGSADCGQIVDDTETDVDKFLNFEDLCAYLKLYHARCRCILVFVDCTYEELEAWEFYISDAEKAKQHLNPFLKYRLLIITKDKMLTGSELMMRLIAD